MRKLALLPVLLSLLCSGSGCALTSEAINTAEVAAAGNERYVALAQKALDGKAVLEVDAVAPVSPDDWKATPESVRILVDRLLNGLEVNRFAFYSISFQLGGGEDPKTLELKSVKLPSEDEGAGLIGGER